MLIRGKQREILYTHTHTHNTTHKRQSDTCDQVARSHWSQRILAARSIHLIAFRAHQDNARSSPHVKLVSILISVKILLPYEKTLVSSED